MYEIRFKGRKQEKKFNRLVESVSKDMREKMRRTLEESPYPSQTHGDKLCKVERKGKLYGYELTGGDRVLFDIFETPKKAVLIHYAGDDDGEIRYLKSYAK